MLKTIGMIGNSLIGIGFLMIFVGCITMAFLESSTYEQFLRHDALLIGFVSYITFLMQRRYIIETA